MKKKYIIIPLFTVLVAATGSVLTARGMQWYRTIALPSWTPRGSVIGTVWTFIFILGTVAALIVWRKSRLNPRLVTIAAAFLVNGILNVMWSYLFFTRHMMGIAALEAVLLGLSVACLMALIRPVSLIASVLLLPYACWVAFASYLTYAVWVLNK